MKKRCLRQACGTPALPSTMRIRLVHIPNACDGDGEPRIALKVPPQPGVHNRRPLILMFASISAALAGKREMEGR